MNSCSAMMALTTSPIEITPTSLSSSITGRWRTRLSVINAMQSSTVCWGRT